jgi:Rab-GTPase-TBC domain
LGGKSYHELKQLNESLNLDDLTVDHRGRVSQVDGITKNWLEALQQILIDLKRTHLPFSMKVDSDTPLPHSSILSCLRVLFVLCEIALPKMGYCQGLNYVVTLFHHIFENNEE